MTLLTATRPVQAQSLALAPSMALKTLPYLASHTWVNVGFYSAHFDRDLPLRNANPGLGLEFKLLDSVSLTAGTYINSDSLRSNYAGVYYQPWRLGPVKLGVVGGGFNGYPKALNGGWFPAVLPVATVELGRLGLNMALIPPIDNRLYGAVSFQLKFRLAD